MNKTSILIVEDEFIISKDLSEMLEEKGYSIAGIASNIEQALQILKKVCV